MSRPSFIIGIISGTVIFIATILFLFNMFKFSRYELINLLFIIGIAYGIHGIQHAYEELYFDFNPLIGKWKPKDESDLKIKTI
jgi:hypothetical protein